MKIRTDFVTNSSSSSFVISYKAMPEIDELTLERYPFIKTSVSMLEKALVGDSGEIIRNIEDLDEYFIDQYGWDNRDTVEKILKDDEDLTETYEKYKVRIEKGYHITFRSVDYSDETTAEIFESLDDGENFIIEGEY